MLNKDPLCESSVECLCAQTELWMEEIQKI